MFFLYPLPCFAAQFSLRPAQYLDAYNRLMRMSDPRNIREYFTNVFVLSFTCILKICKKNGVQRSLTASPTHFVR